MSDPLLSLKAAALEAEDAGLKAACKGLIDYRDRVGPLGFQLEKADDFIGQMRAAIAAAEPKGD